MLSYYRYHVVVRTRQLCPTGLQPSYAKCTIPYSGISCFGINRVKFFNQELYTSLGGNQQAYGAKYVTVTLLSLFSLTRFVITRVSSYVNACKLTAIDYRSLGGRRF